MKQKHYLLQACLIALAIIVGSTTFQQYTRAEATFQRAFNVSLPRSALIVNYTSSISARDNSFCYLHVTLDESEFYQLRSELLGANSFFDLLQAAEDNQEFRSDSFSGSLVPNIQNACSWWDMDESDIISAYSSIRSGKSHRSVSLFVFFVISDNQYSLYAVYPISSRAP